MRTSYKVSLLLIIILSHKSIQAQDIEGYKAYTYKQTDTLEMRLFVKNPTQFNKNKKYPAIIFFFGGGWSSGDILKFKPHADYFSDRGMVTILADYRVRTRHKTTPFDAVSDAKSAIRYLRENAKILHIDVNRIAASGGSAGGHLAAAAALIEGLNDAKDNIKTSAKPNALILFNPVYDNGPTGYGYDRIKERYTEISPLHNIKKGAPPTIVLLGTNDKHMPVSTAELYKQKMEDVGARCDLIIYQDQKHGFFNFRHESGKSNQYYYETLKEADKFLVSLGYISADKK
jgi:acetyl esterase